VQKYKPLIALDFTDQRTDAVVLHMWNRHSTIMQGTCQDDCACLGSVPDMLEGLFDSCGLMTWFMDRHVPLLSAEYPTESSLQLIQRLILMWDEHTKNKFMGETCSKDCKCVAGWLFVFRRGNLTTGMKHSERIARMRQQASTDGVREVQTIDENKANGIFAVSAMEHPCETISRRRPVSDLNDKPPIMEQLPSQVNRIDQTATISQK
jgi:hypothetical protein